MDEDQQGNGGEGILSGLFITLLEEGGVLVKLDRSAGDVRINGAQFVNESFLDLPLPNVAFGINHQEVFAGDPDETVAQGLRKIRRAQRSAIILVLEGMKGFAKITQEGLLKLG